MVKRKEPDEVWGIYHEWVAQASKAEQLLNDDDREIISIQQWGVRRTLAPPCSSWVWVGWGFLVDSIIRVRLSFNSGEEMDTLF